MNVAAPHIVQLDRVSQRPQVSLADEQLRLLAAEPCHRIAPLEGPALGCALIQADEVIRAGAAEGKEKVRLMM